MKNQLPNRDNISNDRQTPIPIEHTFFLEDGERDKFKFNRYYFNFPQEWCTANHGEAIIGVRNIFMLARRRRLEFTITIRKYYKSDYTSKNDNVEFDYDCYNRIDDKRKSSVKVKCVIWLDATDYFKDYFRGLNKYLISAFEEFNEEHKAEEERPKFFQANINEPPFENDVLTDGYYDYDKKTYIELITSPHNTNPDSKYYVEFQLDFESREGHDPTVKDRAYDFEDMFNIGYEPFQNSIYKLKNAPAVSRWFREIRFENIWDRHSCKIYSSFGTSSCNGYVGNTTVVYNPIKYFKLNSSDQRFWIEFYSGRDKEIPIMIPRNESFSIEMQFMPYNKMLYV